MIGTIIPVALLLLVIGAAARRRRRRSNRNFVALPFSVSLDTTTLANDAVVSVPLQANFTEDFRCVSIHALWASAAGTAAEGPLVAGYAHSDYTVTEIAENQNVVLLGPASKSESERAGRLVRRVVQFLGIGGEILNDGKTVKTKLNWMISDAKAITMWVQNRSGAALTNGPVIEITGTMFGRWLI